MKTIFCLLAFFTLSSLITKGNSIPDGCTVITISSNGNVFFGGNDDYINPDSYYWVEQGDSLKLGVIWIGTPDNPQQGVNEKCLAYDANGLPRVGVNPHTERIPVMGEYHRYVMQIMHECSTVEDVIAWVNVHGRPPYMHDQLHFADKTGDAVIISAGKDGEIVFTRKIKGTGFLVSTNFNVANPSNAYGYPCWRYEKASEMMEQLLESGEHLTFQNVTGVLEAVHMEKGSSWTLETMVTDLVNGIMYLYYYYQYDKPVILNIEEEFANPRVPGKLSELFPEDVKIEAAKRYLSATKNIRINNIIGKSWSIALIISVVFFFMFLHSRKGLGFWLPTVIVLGPIAIVVRLVVRKSENMKRWHRILTETAGDLVPLTLGTLIALIIVITMMLGGGFSQIFQLLFIIIPFLLAWLLFHGIILSVSASKSYLSFLMRRLPQVLVTTFIGLAGIFAVSVPLVNRGLTMSQIIPLSPWIVMTWWAISVTGSLAGGFIVYLFERWSVKNGNCGWTSATTESKAIITPGWGALRWWIPLSIIILIVGMIIAIKLLQTT